MKNRTLRSLAIACLLLMGLAVAQNVPFAVAFETLNGDPASPDALASGDIVVLTVSVRNDSASALSSDSIWVAFPPVEGATLFGNTSTGFSFPDRMLDADGNDVTVEYGLYTTTQLHELPETLEPGATGSIALRVSVLSSQNSLAELVDEVRLLDADGQSFGSRVDSLEAP